jgi:hypothetical protein
MLAKIRVRQIPGEDTTETLANGMRQMESQYPGKDYLIRWLKRAIEFVLK